MSREDGKQGCSVLTLLEAISPTERRVCSVSSCSRHQSSSSSVSCASCSPESSGSQVGQGRDPHWEPVPPSSLHLNPRSPGPQLHSLLRVTVTPDRGPRPSLVCNVEGGCSECKCGFGGGACLR